jgi:hypothetical protein
MRVDFLNADSETELRSMLNKLDHNSYRVISIYRQGGSIYAWLELKDLENSEEIKPIMRSK